MLNPTIEELRQLAQEVALETGNDRCIAGVEAAIKDEGIEGGKSYMHGFIANYMEDGTLPEATVRGYFKILDLSEEDVRRQARRRN